MSNLIEIDLKIVCRICLSASEDMKSLYETSFRDIEISLAEILMSFTPVKCYINDGLPTQICENCIGDLHNSYKFQSKCIETEKLLQNHISNTAQIEEINIQQTNNNSAKRHDSNPEDTPPNKQRDPLAIPSTEPSETQPETHDSQSEAAIVYPTKNYPCTFCGSAFKRKENLKVHIRKHTGEKPYACPVCGALFNRSTSLKRHMTMHTGEKPYSCEVCRISFSLRTSWKRHMRRHVGEKPYLCTICYSAFCLKAHLTEHMRTHPPLKPFKCTVCAYSFRHKYDLNRHLRVHKPKHLAPLRPKTPDLITFNIDSQPIHDDAPLILKDPLEIAEIQVACDHKLDLTETAAIIEVEEAPSAEPKLYSCLLGEKPFDDNQNLMTPLTSDVT